MNFHRGNWWKIHPTKQLGSGPGIPSQQQLLTATPWVDAHPLLCQPGSRKSAPGRSSDSGFFWVRRVSVLHSFSIFCGWETLGIEGSIFLGYVELGKPEVNWRWRSLENQVIDIPIKESEKKTRKLSDSTRKIIHWNQIIKKKSSTGKLSTKTVIVPISPGFRCWPGPSGNLLQPQNGKEDCKRSMGKCTPWSTLSIQHCFPLFSPKAFKNFAQLTGFDLF